MSNTWITAFSSIVGAASFVMLLLQVKWNFDQSRRIKAYDVLAAFSNNESHAMATAVDIVDNLNPQQIADIINGKNNRFKVSFKINRKVFRKP